MSSDIAINVERLSKCYQIYEKPQDRLKQSIFPRLQRWFGKMPMQYFREFWALRDVSFTVGKGETVGIIGRNGSGKSTLLQLICNTLAPTAGTIQTKGRIAALLELGTGFNPEFTGRENVYFNASVLGLTTEEIDARFPDIVTFADIGDFIDQPVKSYSSGMYVRLAFAVVVHVDPDILIVDEALAVGDMYFQAKCMAQMKKFMEAGVTVLFVSHDIGAVKSLCQRAIYLDKGRVMAMGSTDEVTEAYYGAGIAANSPGISAKSCEPGLEWQNNFSGFTEADLAAQSAFSARAQFHRIQNGMAELLNVQLFDPSGNALDVVDFGQDVILRVTLMGRVGLPSIGLAYHIRDRNGADVVYSDTGIEKCHIIDLGENEIIIMDWSFKVTLCAGNYTIAIMLSIPQDLNLGQVEVCDFVPLAKNFQVTRGNNLPLYGYVYWPNKISVKRFSTPT